MNKNKLFLIFTLIIETILIKWFQFNFLPAKYFYDSKHILKIMNSSEKADLAYTFTAKVFNIFNIFNFYTIKQWGIFLSIIFTIIILIVLLKYDKFSISEYIFVYASVALLNIFVFVISKDILQLVFFLLIYVVLKARWKNVVKLVITSSILLFEALEFRIYYAIMATNLISIYIIYNMFFKNTVIDKKNVLKILILIFFAFFVEIFVVGKLSYNNYISILYARSNVNINREASIDAITIINDLLGRNTNYLKFIINYIINFIRMLIPIELLFKGIRYIPFIVYQIYITINLLKCIKKLNTSNLLWSIILLSFIMTSVIFEPDFGSFIRHESATFFITQYIILKIIN